MQAPCDDMDTDNPETTALDAVPGVADPELPVLQISSDAIVQTAHCARSPARAERVGQELVNHVDVNDKCGGACNEKERHSHSDDGHVRPNTSESDAEHDKPECTSGGGGFGAECKCECQP